jgi:hypothetical protein
MAKRRSPAFEIPSRCCHCTIAPCAVLAAQNRLKQEMVAQVIALFFAVGACLIGVNWA